jgi:hypothetical protein
LAVPNRSKRQYGLGIAREETMNKTSRSTYEPMDAVIELSRMARYVALEDIQTLVYDLEHRAPMSVECALARAFLSWRKQLEQLRVGSEQRKGG